MTTTLDDFVQRRQQAAKLLEQLADVVDGLELPESSLSQPRYLRLTAERAREGRFVVLLLGCFSSGKSTLLNALLGRPVLPVKVNPCTAILTEVVYGAKPAVEIRNTDGGSEKLELDEFVSTFQLHTNSTAEAGAEASDRFGHAVALDGTWALVGALLSDDNGPSSGSAYVFDLSTLAAPAENAKLTASDGAGGDYLGNSLGISGTNALVGAPNDDDKGSNAGAAYLFDADPPCARSYCTTITGSPSNKATLTASGCALTGDISLSLAGAEQKHSS